MTQTTALPAPAKYRLHRPAPGTYVVHLLNTNAPITDHYITRGDRYWITHTNGHTRVHLTLRDGIISILTLTATI